MTMNKRRIDDITCRPDNHSATAIPPNAYPINSHNPCASLISSAGYVRAPPSNLSVTTQVSRLQQAAVLALPVSVAGTHNASHDHSQVFGTAQAQRTEGHVAVHNAPYPATATIPNPVEIKGLEAATIIEQLLLPQVRNPVANNTMAANATVLVTSPNQGPVQYQKLKVEDALSYLDRVKLKFGDQPKVYNDFLDIMKEFKSQSIDTPGVIARVSELFKGHPELTYGFNTFLPPGYKIEVNTIGSNQHMTVVHTPQGIQHLNSAVNSSLPITTIKQAVVQQPNPRTNVTQLAGVNLATTSAQPTSMSVSQTPKVVTTPVPLVQPPPITSMPTNGASILNQPPPQPSGPQPVEFNHAINYVNKIKNRFQDQLETYKQFLEILHTYQKEQKFVKEAGNAPSRGMLTESEVYDKVAKLFLNEEDLLEEFGQFLPDATNTNASTAVSSFMDQCPWTNTTLNNKLAVPDLPSKKSMLKAPSQNCGSMPPLSNTATTASLVGGSSYANPNKRSMPSSPNFQPAKKPKLAFLKDMSAAEAGKFAALSEYGYFDKVRKALRSEETYNNFLRCIQVFNDGIVSRSELVLMTKSFFIQFPDLANELKVMLNANGEDILHERIPSPIAKQERISADLALEIDYTTCKRLGASYCALPKTHYQPTCSGRTALCKQVLNDTWVSFPSWSEDSTFVTSKKTVFEENIYRCEDERFELDVVLETNMATTRVLEGVQYRMNRMSAEELSKFQLDDCLGGDSPTIHRISISRIYGEKGCDIIDGLKRNPSVAVPLVLRRLKSKTEEWREAQKGFNKTWREQNERNYLKSLDHQFVAFKANDAKAFRSKFLINEIETLYDERHEQAEEGCEVDVGPHLVLPFKDKSVLDDATNLIIHHVRRQQGTSKEDKAKIKALMRQFIPDLYFHPRMEQSDDEKDEGEEDSDCSIGKDLKPQVDHSTTSNGATVTGSSKRKTRAFKATDSLESPRGSPLIDPVVNGDREKSPVAVKSEPISPPRSPIHRQHGYPMPIAGEEYKLFLCNNNWYLLLRLHHLLCTRLSLMLEHAARLVVEEAKENKERTESAALALKLRPNSGITADRYYPMLLEYIKSLLDGNIETGTYEDSLRDMFGIHAYHAFTLEKIVNNAVRQLQHIVTDELPMRCTEAFLVEARRGGAGGPCISAYRRQHIEINYQKRMEKLHSEDNCFKIRTFKKEWQLAIELLDTEGDECGEENGSGSPVSNNDLPRGVSSNPPIATPVIAGTERWSQYVDRYVSTSTSHLLPAVQAKLAVKPVFLVRNLRSWIKFTTNKEKRNEPYQDQHMQIDDNTQCKINANTYKMVFVVNSDSFMYKKQALEKARTSHKVVTQRMKKGLDAFVSKWCDEKIGKEDVDAAYNWFTGKSDELVANVTKIETRESTDRTPYYTYTKYHSKILPP